MMTASAFGKRVRIDFPKGGGDHIRKQMFKRGWYERDMLLDMYKFVRSGGLALDVGAYCGTHTLWLARICGMRVYAFEPAPEAFHVLKDNVLRNMLQRQVKLVEAGVGARAGAGRCLPSEDPTNTGAARFAYDAEGTVPVVTIDQYNLSDVAIMKIDVEGAEMAVLEGAVNTIARCRPRLYVETDEPARVLAFLAPYEYQQVSVFNATPTYCFAPMPQEVRLSATIMAHPKRERHIPYLQAKMGGNIPVTWDTQNNRWDTGRRAMLAFDPEASHHLVVQDDALLCEDFMPGIRAALKYVPDNPVAFYAGAVRPRAVEVERRMRMARGERKNWFQMEGPWWGVAVAIPTKFIPEMVQHCDALKGIDNYDMRLSRFFGARRIKCYYTVPSLVNHRVGREEPSLVPGRGNLSGRVALDFIGENVSALSIDWSKI